MVICKYFLRGTCRFGESCKNEHSYNSETTASVMRKKADVDPNVLIKTVSNDMDKAEKGNQWPISCYGPFQAKHCFPGFDDKCFEEIRLGMYEAEKNGTVEQYKQQLTQLLHEIRMKMRSLQNPTAEASHVLLEMYNSNVSEQPTPNVFASTNTFGNSPIQSNSMFGNPGAASKSIFNNQTTAPSFTFALPENKSIFGNTAPSTNSASIFGQPSQQSFSSGGGIFGGGGQIQPQNQNAFSTPSNNVFQNANAHNYSQSIFGSTPAVSNQLPFGGSAQVPQSTSNIFMQNNQPPNPFKQNIQTPSAGQSPFGAPAVNLSPFGAPQASQPTFGTPVVTNQPTFGSVANQAPLNPSPFGGSFPTSNTNQSPFAQTNTIQSVFAPPQIPFGANQSPFVGTTATASVNSSPFASLNTSTDHSRNIFGSPQSTIIAAATRQDDETVYSKLEHLSENDVKCFENSSFVFGNIPDKPPTLQMCS